MAIITVERITFADKPSRGTKTKMVFLNFPQHLIDGDDNNDDDDENIIMGVFPRSHYRQRDGNNNILVYTPI